MRNIFNEVYEHMREKSKTDKLIVKNKEIDQKKKTCLTNREREVVENKRSKVKIISKLTNFRKYTRIEGYIGK